MLYEFRHGGDTQQYEFVVATGEALERFKKENREALMSGEKPLPDVPMRRYNGLRLFIRRIFNVPESRRIIKGTSRLRQL